MSSKIQIRNTLMCRKNLKYYKYIRKMNVIRCSEVADIHSEATVSVQQPVTMRESHSICPAACYNEGEPQYLSSSL
jgi:hypothetical protein